MEELKQGVSIYWSFCSRHMDEWCWTFIAQQCLVFGEGPHAEVAFVRADPKSRHLCCMKLIGYSETETGQAIQKRWHNRNRNAFILIRFPMRCVKSLGIHAHLLLLETHIFSFFHFFFSIKLFYCLHNWTCVSYNKDL